MLVRYEMALRDAEVKTETSLARKAMFSAGSPRAMRQSADLVIQRFYCLGQLSSSARGGTSTRSRYVRISCPSSSCWCCHRPSSQAQVDWARSHSSSSSRHEKEERGVASQKAGINSAATSWAKQLRSIPNIITVSRIASTPILSYLIVTESYQYAVGGCILFGLSDWLDGYIARNYEGQSTVLGTYLDPLADKFMINTLAVSLWYTALLPGPLVGIWLARDVGLIVTSFVFVANRTKGGESVINPETTPLKVQPSTISKVNTVLQFCTISGGMAQPLVGLDPNIVLGLCWITGGTTILSGLGYIGGKSMIASGNHHDLGKK